MDDTYERLVIGGKVVVKVEVVNKDIQVTWADDWGRMARTAGQPGR